MLLSLITLKVEHSGMKLIHWLAIMLTIIGGFNWGLIGLANIDLITIIFGNATTLSRGIYMAIGISSIYLLINIKNLG